jgi:RimJ/RimL family protein N-acetyltransferase
MPETTLPDVMTRRNIRIEKEGFVCRLRLVERSDAEFILRLRTDPVLSRYLNPTDDSLEKQLRWMEEYEKREQSGTDFYFIIEDHRGIPLGTFRLYNIDGKSGVYEAGSWIVSPDAPRETANESFYLLFDYAFAEHDLAVYEGVVRRDNKKSLQFNICCGNKVYREDEQNCYVRMTEQDFRESVIGRMFADEN